MAYYGLINPRVQSLNVNLHAKEVKWVNIDEALKMNLAFDHNKILEYGLQRLRNKLRYEPIGFNLLGEFFTMTDIWKMYSTILHKDIDRGNFHRKIMSFGFLNKTNEKTDGLNGKGRKSLLYRFDGNKYKELKENGIYFEI